MNYRNVIFQLGLLLLVISAFVLVIGGWALTHDLLLDRGIEPRHAAWSLLITAGIGTLLGGACVLCTRTRDKFLGRREAMLLVALSWVIGAALAALPFYIWALELPASETPHPLQNFINCYFESISGFTTAGSSVLTDIEALPWSLLFWRQFIQWIGGIGIVVLFVAVFPSLGVGARRLFEFESSGEPTGIMPAIRHTARMLLIIYIVLTALESIALIIAGMPAIEAIEHSFTTLATGGFSTKNSSIGAYDTVAIDIIVTVFMIVGGVNFTLYYALLRRKHTSVWRDRELLLYLILFGVSTIVIAIMLTDRTIVTTAGDEIDATFGQSLRYAAFNVASVQTTTGFATADYDQWPVLARAILFTLILIGGCAGSTAGGLKVTRLIVAAKVLFSMIERAYRPQVVRPIKISGKPIRADLQLETFGYILATLILLSMGTLLVLLFEPTGECDLVTAASANLATFCTTGPGFGRVGPISNFGWMTNASKLVLCAVMLLGRLELFAIIVLFSPRFWRTE